MSAQSAQEVEVNEKVKRQKAVRKDERMELRLSEDELLAIDEAAHSMGLSRAAFVRLAALQEARKTKATISSLGA